MSTAIAIHEGTMSADLSPARMTAMTFLQGGSGRMEETNLAVIVEGIVYGVYSSARESAYITGAIRTSGITCEIFRHE